MDFTYRSYVEMIERLRRNDYRITDYHDWNKLPHGSKCAILRHDIDFDIQKAVDLARVERDEGVTSTYFVLISSPMYNVLSARSCEMLDKIRNMGHSIGLHYDEMRYPGLSGDTGAVTESILGEIRIFEMILGQEVDVVSMHRPSKEILDNDLSIPGVINSYGKVFFDEFKYISDSRKRWREPICDIIDSCKYDKIHILTHAFWYDERECSIHDSVLNWINGANIVRYCDLRDNITDIESIIDSGEVMT